MDVAVTVTVDPTAYAGGRTSPTAELAARGFREVSVAVDGTLETFRGIAEERVLGLFAGVPGVVMIARGGPAETLPLRERDPRVNDALEALQGAVFERRPFRVAEARRPARCAACRAAFLDPQSSARDARRAAQHPEMFVEGYSTQTPRGTEWLCPRCFGELRGALGWTAA